MKKNFFLIIFLSAASALFSQPASTKNFNACFADRSDDQPMVSSSDSTPVVTVNAEVALHSLMSISDARMLEVAHILTILSTTEAVRSGNWELIQSPLAAAARMNVPAVYWFARPDGSYWTLGKGRAATTISDREYFPLLMAGKKVIGQLVVSRSTNFNTAIVAVPVFGANHSIVGALGCSVYLDSLSAIIRNEMGVHGEKWFFYSFDSKPLVALHSDPTVIFIEPMKQKDEGLQQAFKEMLQQNSGMVKYTFRGVRRTVLYCKSPATGWWYGFGRIEQ